MFCREEPAAADLIRFLPLLVRYRVEDAILVFELISDAATLQTGWAEQIGRGHEIEAARAFGQAMGTVHRVFRRVNPEHHPRLNWLPRAYALDS